MIENQDVKFISPEQEKEFVNNRREIYKTNAAYDKADSIADGTIHLGFSALQSFGSPAVGFFSGALEKGWDHAREQGMPIFSRPPQQNEPIIVVTDLENPHYYRPGDLEPTYLSPPDPTLDKVPFDKISITNAIHIQVKNRVTQNFLQIGLTEKDAKTIIDTALDKTNLRLDQVDQKLESVITWQKKYDKEQKNANERADTQANLQNINQFAGFLGELGAVTGSRELQQFSVIAQAGITITGGIIGIMAATGPMMLLGPIGIIGSAALSILSLFMKKGPDPSQIIMDQIQALSKQLSRLGQYMGEQFEQNAKMQRYIIKTVDRGFFNLSKQLAEQVGSLREELRVEFNYIHESLSYLGQYIEINARNQCLAPFNDICLNVNRCVENFSGDMGKTQQIQELSFGLENWLIEHSANEILTSIAFIKSHPPKKTINEILGNINDHQLNAMLGYFDFCSQEENYKLNLTDPLANQLINKTLEKMDKIPNPEIRSLAIDHYISLKTEFPIVETDNRNRRLDKIITAGQKGVNLLERIEKDENFWNGLLGHYYDCLKAVYKTAHGYARLYNQRQVDKLNNDYCDSDIFIIEQGKIQFSLLENPSTFITKFSNRSINHVNNDLIIDCPLHSDIPHEKKKLNKTHLHNHLKTHIPPIFLAAEYLKLISFQTIQDRVQGISTKEKAYHNAIPLTLMEKTVLAYPKGLGEGEGGVCIASLDSYNISSPNWSFSLHLKYKADGQENPLALLNYSGLWNSFISPEGVGTYRGKNDAKQLINGTYFDASYSSPREIEVLHEHIGKFVLDEWNNNVLPTISGFASDTTVSNKINNYYLHHRQTIAYNLIHKQGSTGQAELEQFHQALLVLDICVKQIHLYAYLIGINPEHADLNLITSGKVISDLSHYDMNSQLIASIPEKKTPIDRRINYQSIKKIEAIQLSHFHPKRLLIIGQRRLEAYKGWKKLYKEHFPNFSTYVNLETYRQECNSLRDRMFQEHVYQQFKAIRERKYKEAVDRFQISYDGVMSLSKKEYKKNCLKIFQWAKLHAQDVLATQYLTNIPITNDSLDTTKIITDGENQELTFMHLKKHSWVWDIRTLMDMAERLGGVKFSPDLKAINFSMWSEGAISYLQHIIFNSSINEIAIEAEDTPRARLILVGQLETLGNNLKNIILKIAESSELFTNLFNGYLQIFNEFFDLVKLKIEQRAILSPEQDDRDIYDFLTQEPQSGALDQFLNRLSVYGIWINAYIEMCFAYELENFKQILKFKDKIDMKEYLNPASHKKQKTSILDRLIHYKNQVEALRKTTFYRIEYAKELSTFKSYLANYCQANKPGNRLLLDSNALGAFGLIPEKLDLIDQFLQVSKNKICEIELNKIQFNSLSLANLLEILSKPQVSAIQSIIFRDCQLPDNALVLLKFALTKRIGIQELELSGNDFSSMWQLNQLKDLLSSIKPLVKLNLSHNALGDKGICMVLLSLNSHFSHLKELVLDRNPIQSKSYSALKFLVQKAINLRNLSLSGMELSSVALDFLSQGAMLPQLESINLASNPLGSSDIEKIKSFLKISINLQQLNMADTQLNDKSVMLVAIQISALIKKLKMKQCDLSKNPMVSSKNIGVLKKHLVNIDTLKLPDDTVIVSQIKDFPTYDGNTTQFAGYTLNIYSRIGQPALDFLLDQLSAAKKSLTYYSDRLAIENVHYTELLNAIREKHTESFLGSDEDLIHFLLAQKDEESHSQANQLIESSKNLANAEKLEKKGLLAFNTDIHQFHHSENLMQHGIFKAEIGKSTSFDNSHKNHSSEQSASGKTHSF